MSSIAHPKTWPIPLAQHIPTLIFISVTVLTSTLTSRTQPTPYIDEIFHIPQAQRYCSALSGSSLTTVAEVWQKLRGVDYDAKLTTPPGLYAISVGLAQLMPGWGCGDVAWLRNTNLVLLLTLPVLVARIVRQDEEAMLETSRSTIQQPPKPARAKKAISRYAIQQLQAQAKLEQPPTPTTSQDDLTNVDPPTVTLTNGAPPAPPQAALSRAPKRKEATPYTMAVACTICFLPPLWFFGFLYYTDLASIWLVLATWTLYNDLNQRSSLRTGTMIAVVSMWAVLVRQTNIVWVVFCAGQAILARVARLSAPESRGLILEIRGTLVAAVGRQRMDFWRIVAVNVLPMVPMLVGCAWFIHWNGSIVLGDKTNHQAGVHLAQMGYFLAFASGFGIFPLLSALQASPTTRASSSSHSSITAAIRAPINTVAQAAFGSTSGIATLAATLAAFYIAVDRYTLEHPFLLADNRHYTFYVWRIFHRPYSVLGVAIEPKYVAVPLYAIALTAWNCALARNRNRGVLVRVLFWTAAAATLVPTPLVEPRYYLLPYVVLRVMCLSVEGGSKWTWLALEVAVYGVVNAVTVGLFVGRPFEWAAGAVDAARGEGTTMRFIW
ncbi:hypothetical protein EX895_002908 [Sporisorium graminicola]|uniref:Dol-P-Glc:Glc(2)Man(9)GlcNAc(2)-PP-Dol alpha-1,2-glucosyltransferase n=1 Tax=Sporisorium graminicola TaxID=280036 RepID=A0A4U7KXS0_9BASI|nr:hypothetical protein EX895_002908 [Sporisorium graminicola]TKY88198.1 hypothetical protein EX895_002908 [Sporisorium graminicola]